MSALSVANVGVRFGRRQVIEAMTLPPFIAGEFTVLAGPNAAGKSTLLRAIAQLVPASGTIALDGRPLSGLSLVERARTIGFMPQQLYTDASLSVLEGLMAALHAGGGFAGPGGERRCLAVLERLGIAGLALEPLSRLSGGQRQAVGLAQAIVRDPGILLLDEPTSMLDLSRQFLLLSEARRLAREGRIVIAVLHDLGLAAQWADRIVMMHHGRPDTSGPPAKVLTPQTLARVYGVDARVEACSSGRIMVMVDGVDASVKNPPQPTSPAKGEPA